jgi:hypothetical protein
MFRCTAPLALAAVTLVGVGCTSVASVEGPSPRQQLHQPQPVAVTLTDRADADTFRATLDGRDITEHFTLDRQRAVLDGYVYEPRPGRQPHELTVQTQPQVNAKGRAIGQPFTQTLTYFPPALTLQGNVGMGVRSHVNLDADGRASVLVQLPLASPEPRTLTVRALAHHDASDGLADCVAVFNVHGRAAGLAVLRVEAPGYVARTLDVVVDPATVAAVETGY